MKRLIIVLTLLSLGLGGCVTTSEKSTNMTDLHSLQSLTQQDVTIGRPTISKIRYKALKETALSLGAQGGLAWRAKQINEDLEARSDNLDKIFNFNGLLLEHSVLPPVLRESHESLKLDSPDVIRTANRTYKIIKQARFVTTSPTWRDYLLFDYKTPEMPDSTLLPQTADERFIWVKDVQLGWKSGIKQANTIYADGLAKLHNDFQGMLLYRKLLSRHMVSKPYVAKTNMGVTSNSDHTEMRVDDRILRITAKPQLETNSQQWKPVVVQP